MVLLTGATGSLGGHLCAELLAATTASVHCLVRATDRATASDRVTTRLSRLEDPPPPAGERLTVHPADLAHPSLGLDAREYDCLAENVEVIVHCAAQVDLAADYARLAPANVEGTRHLITLAHRRTRLTGHPPAFHYVSSLAAVLDARRAGITEVDERAEVSEATSGPLGYPRSKAVAELALRQAANEGLPVTVHRPAVVTGHSRTGRTSSSDVLTPMLWAALALGAMPTSDAAVPAERVDVVARAIVALLSTPDVAGRAFHLIHPRPLPLSALFEALLRAGHPLKSVPTGEWWRMIDKHADHPAVHPMASMSEIGRFMLAVDDNHTPARFRSDETWTTLATQGLEPRPLDQTFLDLLVSHLATPDPIAKTPPVPASSRTSAATSLSPLRIDGLLAPLRFDHDGGFPDAVGAATTCETAGYGMFWAQEQNHDPVPALAAAASVTRTIGIGTNVLVALARSPMTVAHAAHDLQALSGGRFILGLGPQFAANLKYRFSMPSDRRRARMREYVAALRAIWASWNEGRPLAFRGEFYTHTLTSPFFTPPPNPHGPPPVILAATGPRMAELAGEIADGMAAPPYANPDHLNDVLLPAVERGLATSGRTREDFTITVAPLLVTGPEDATHARSLLALWCGSRAYRFVFEPYDLGGLADELAELSLAADPDRWRRMADRIDDRTLDLFTITATPGRLGSALREAFAGRADRVIVPAPLGPYTPAALGLAAADPHLEAP